MEIAVFLFLLKIFQVSASEYDLSDYTTHPCIRPCVEGAPPMTCEYDFTLETYRVMGRACYHCPFNITDCFRPHCVSGNGIERMISVANKILPGPAIHVCVGDTIVLNVHNALDDTSGADIHFHGFHQRGTPWMDGVSMVTQCPIHESSSFEYRFEAFPAGTHWWHAHSATLRGDGIYGAAIVRKPMSIDANADEYDHDLQEHTILVNDWLDTPLISFFSRIHFSRTLYRAYGLFNGRGAGQTYSNENGTFEMPRAEFIVTQGERYRFRVINSAMLCSMSIFIMNHTMTLIATEAGDIIPHTVDYMVLDPGERYDVVVTANQDIGSYWIRMIGVDTSCQYIYESAVLRYDGSDSEPHGDNDRDSYTATGNGINLMNEAETDAAPHVYQLTSTEPADDITNNDTKVHTYYITMDYRLVENSKMHHPDHYSVFDDDVISRRPTQQMNYITNVLAPSPLLTQLDEIPPEILCSAYTVGKNCSTEFCKCVHVIKFDLGEIVELVVTAEGHPAGNHHPVHLHGHAFRVMGIGKIADTITLDEIKELDKQGKLIRRFESTPLKDTVTVPDGGYTILRFRADNPGMWLFHCHRATHLKMGMAVIIQVGPSKHFPKPPLNFPSCRNFVSRSNNQVRNCVAKRAKKVPKRLRQLLMAINPKYLRKITPCYE